jgi:twitching motility two-component system response regulator PilH
MSGFEATRAITKDPETSGIPVIICSTKGQETDKAWGLRQGAKDYLVKPVNEKALMEKIGSL